MYERCLNEAERMLATSKEVVLPIKHLWKTLAEEGRRRTFDVPSLTDFDALLEGDKRFEIISAQTDPEEIEALALENGEEIDSSLGTLGFYPEDRVKLKRVKPMGQIPGGSALLKEIEDDEEVVPLNVRGLSTTRPVARVGRRKQVTKKTVTKSTSRAKSSSGSRKKQAAKSRTVTAKRARKSSRGSR
jgi:hypothetical protein